MKEQQEEKKEMCPICKSQNIEYNDFFGIQCKNCGQLITPVPLVEQPVKTEEKDKLFELAEHRRKVIDRQIIELGNQDAEIKRLKGLIEELYEEEVKSVSWEQFKKQNKL